MELDKSIKRLLPDGSKKCNLFSITNDSLSFAHITTLRFDQFLLHLCKQIH
jgi:hypothetical protein